MITELPSALYGDAVALWHEAELTRPWNDPTADLQRAVSGNSSTVLAAVDADDRLLGTAMVGHDGHRAWVYYLAVAATERRRGVGRELMTGCENWARQHNMPKIQLMVRHENAHVMAFYNALGYVDADCAVLGRFLDA